MTEQEFSILNYVEIAKQNNGMDKSLASIMVACTANSLLKDIEHFGIDDYNMVDLLGYLYFMKKYFLEHEEQLKYRCKDKKVGTSTNDIFETFNEMLIYISNVDDFISGKTYNKSILLVSISKIINEGTQNPDFIKRYKKEEEPATDAIMTFYRLLKYIENL